MAVWVCRLAEQSEISQRCVKSEKACTLNVADGVHHVHLAEQALRAPVECCHVAARTAEQQKAPISSVAHSIRTELVQSKLKVLQELSEQYRPF